MATVDVAQEHHRRLDAFGRSTVRRVLAEWRRMRPRDLDASWAEIEEQVVALVASGQLAAAGSAESYVSEIVDAERSGRLSPRSLSGVASDGRTLDGLMLTALTATKDQIGRGASGEMALQSGAAFLTRAALTQVADAGRAAESVAVSSRPDVGGYVRMISPDACGRCVVLAGRFYRWNSGFLRHPGCRCRHVPSSENVPGDIQTDPRNYFDSLSEDQQNKAFTNAGAQSIRDGADISQVVNARRGALGLSSPGRLTAAEQRMLRGGLDRGQLQRSDVFGRELFTTTEGTTVRGVAGRRLARRGGTFRERGERVRRARAPRLMPESIYEIAEDRADAIRLLRLNGYIN